MLGTFLGLQTALRGLQTMQTAIETTSHNIDNSNTPGYSRQRVDLTAAQPLEVPGLQSTYPGQIGTGVQVQQIQRLQSNFLNAQYRDQNQYLGAWNVRQDTLNKIAAVVNEPSTTGISSTLQNFWTSWDKLSTNPGPSTQMLVSQSAVTLTQTLNQTAQQFSDLQSNLTTGLQDQVTQVNNDLAQIASLNKQIDAITATGNQPNDLMDQRGHLVDQLSQLANISVQQSSSSSPYQISIGNNVVLSDQTVSTTTDPVTGNQVPVVRYDNSSTNPNAPLSIPVSGGELKGYVDSLSTLQNYQNDLNSFANSLANGPTTVTLPGDWTIQPGAGNTPPVLPVDVTINGTLYPANTPVSSISSTYVNATTNVATIPQGTVVTVNGLNALQQMGYDGNGNPGQALFVPSSGTSITAANISVSSAITSDVTKLSAGLSTASGDGTLAIATSSMQSANMQFATPAGATTPVALTSGTPNGFLQAMVSQLGVQGQQANQEVANQQNLVQQIDTQRQSVSGVSLDQEMANLIQYQQAYTASAKVITAINSMLTTLLQQVP